MYFRRNSSFLFIVCFVSSILAFYFVNASAFAPRGFGRSTSKSTLSFRSPFLLFLILLVRQLLARLVDDSGFGVKDIALNLATIISLSVSFLVLLYRLVVLSCLMNAFCLFFYFLADCLVY